MSTSRVGRHRRVAAPPLVPLVDEPNLDALASELRPPDEQVKLGLKAIERLRSRRADGTLDVLTETQIEQSFNERLFAEVFDYRTLLRHGAREFDFKVKKRRTLKSGVRTDDFSLGTFGDLGGGDRARVTGELKGPGGIVPRTITQAHTAAAKDPDVRWVVVSDFDEIRLYRQGQPHRAAVQHLSRVETTREFGRIWALLCRESLVAPLGGRTLLEEIVMGNALVLGEVPGKLRLVHEAVVGGGVEQRALLHRLDDACRECLRSCSSTFRSADRPELGTQWPPMGLAQKMSALEGDRLRRTWPLPTGETFMFDATRSGVLRLTEHLPSMSINAEALVDRLAKFVGVAVGITRRAFPDAHHDVTFSWRLYDLQQSAGPARLDMKDVQGWAPNPHMPQAEAAPGVQAASYESSTVRVAAVEQNANMRANLVNTLDSAVRELAFAFIDPNVQQHVRVGDGDVAKLTKAILDALDV